jgi:hypothetical protein
MDALRETRRRQARREIAKNAHLSTTSMPSAMPNVRSYSNSDLVAATPSDLDERSGDPVGRSFAPTASKPTWHQRRHTRIATPCLKRVLPETLGG